MLRQKGHIRMNRMKQFLRMNPMIWLFMGIEGFYWMGGTAFSYQSVYLKGLGMDATTIGYITALCSVIAIIASPMWGILCDKLRDTRRVTVVCLLLSSVFWALVPATSAWMLGPVTFLLIMIPLTNFFKAPAMTLMETVVLDGCARERITYSTVRTSGSLFYALVCFLLVQVLPKVGYENIFYFYGILMIPTMILIYKSGRKDEQIKMAKPLSLKEMHLGSLLANSPMLCYLIFSFFSVLPLNTSFTYMPYLLEEIGSADSMVGLIVGIRALLEIPGLLSGPFLCRKFSPKMVLIFAAVLMALEHLLYSVVTNLPTVLILSVIHGVAAGLRLALAMFYVKALAPAHLQATALTVNATINNMAAITGNMIAGSLIALLGIRGFYGLMGGVLTFGILFWIITWRFTPKVDVTYS